MTDKSTQLAALNGDPVALVTVMSAARVTLSDGVLEKVQAFLMQRDWPATLSAREVREYVNAPSWYKDAARVIGSHMRCLGYAKRGTMWHYGVKPLGRTRKKHGFRVTQDDLKRMRRVDLVRLVERAQQELERRGS